MRRLRSRVIARVRLCQAKIEQGDLAGLSNFQIVRLDVAMNDLAIACVQINQRV